MLIVSKKAGLFDRKSTEVYELDIEVDWKTLQRRIDFAASYEMHVSVDNDVRPCAVLTVDDICGFTKDDEEMSEIAKDDVEIISFSVAVKGLETFIRFIESVQNVQESIF